MKPIFDILADITFKENLTTKKNTVSNLADVIPKRFWDLRQSVKGLMTCCAFNMGLGLTFFLSSCGEPENDKNIKPIATVATSITIEGTKEMPLKLTDIIYDNADSSLTMSRHIPGGDYKEIWKISASTKYKNNYRVNAMGEALKPENILSVGSQVGQYRSVKQPFTKMDVSLYAENACLAISTDGKYAVVGANYGDHGGFYAKNTESAEQIKVVLTKGKWSLLPTPDSQVNDAGAADETYIVKVTPN
jgi:hypothetical protein